MKNEGRRSSRDMNVRNQRVSFFFQTFSDVGERFVGWLQASFPLDRLGMGSAGDATKESEVPSVDRAYFLRHATLERKAAGRAGDPRTRLMHQDAARVYEALAAKAAAAAGNKSDLAG